MAVDQDNFIECLQFAYSRLQGQVGEVGHLLNREIQIAHQGFKDHTQSSMFVHTTTSVEKPEELVFPETVQASVETDSKFHNSSIHTHSKKITESTRTKSALDKSHFDITNGSTFVDPTRNHFHHSTGTFAAEYSLATNQKRKVFEFPKENSDPYNAPKNLSTMSKEMTQTPFSF